MTDKAIPSKGASVQHTTLGGSTWVTIPYVRDIELPEESTTFEDATTQEDSHERSVPTQQALGNLTLEINYDHNNNLHGNSSSGPGLRYLQQNKVKRLFRVIDKNSIVLSQFDGWVASISRPVPFAGLFRASVQIKPDGEDLTPLLEE